MSIDEWQDFCHIDWKWGFARWCCVLRLLLRKHRFRRRLRFLPRAVVAALSSKLTINRLVLPKNGYGILVMALPKTKFARNHINSRIYLVHTQLLFKYGKATYSTWNRNRLPFIPSLRLILNWHHFLVVWIPMRFLPTNLIRILT